MFLIVGAYVGYHANQQFMEEGGEYNITIELEIFNERAGMVQIYQSPEFKKSIL